MNSPAPIQPAADRQTSTVLDVVLLPSTVEPESLAGKTVVVVDVLRATTTITNAIANGCQRVLPQPTIEAAKQTFERLESDPATQGSSMIGGERGGRIVAGFHRGNSPTEYAPAVIAGKTLILATTNGTVAMEHCRLANRVLIGSMINLETVAREIAADAEITVVCSGTDRIITGEDVLFAGALVDRVRQLRQQQTASSQLTDTATIASAHWNQARSAIEKGIQSLADCFRNCRGGISLSRIGHDADIDFAAQIDTVPVLSELNLQAWEIVKR